MHAFERHSGDLYMRSAEVISVTDLQKSQYAPRHLLPAIKAAASLEGLGELVRTDGLGPTLVTREAQALFGAR
ncbi:MAG: hypothetical protein ACJ768_02335 [Gaiellaceae bacterium]